ncbi:hypothetical protein BC941DRAFT_439934 [Chlamydoabsidia padenii]|nr:hypothetical protein BC941DRAFT_439934 [Chlamydoabsidia padenii]
MLFRLLTQPIRLQVRRAPTTSCFYTTTNTSSSGSSASQFADSVTKKFIDQAKKGYPSRSSGTPSRFVVIDNLPSTATTEDIRKLAREAFPKGDKSINETIFCRNQEFKFFGRCVVQLDSPENAKKLVEYGNSRLLGGHNIKVVFANNESNNNTEFINKLRRHELLSKTDATSAAGRSVVVSGLPSRTQTDHVMGILRSKNLFPVEGTSDSVKRLRTKPKSTISKFLVKFDSESEAWRCVRSFHNKDFDHKEKNQQYRLNVSVAY